MELIVEFKQKKKTNKQQKKQRDSNKTCFNFKLYIYNVISVHNKTYFLVLKFEKKNADKCHLQHNINVCFHLFFPNIDQALSLYQTTKLWTCRN